MGRQKNTPKKSKSPEAELWSVPDYIPVLKRKRKIKSFASPNNFKVLCSTELNRQYFLGKMLVGTSNNVFPDCFHSFKVSLKSNDNEEDTDAAIIECGSTTVLVLIRLTIDMDFFKEIIQNKNFCMDFEKDNEDVYAKLYLQTLPLLKFYPKAASCIKTVFQLLLNIETSTAEDYKKDLHGNSEVLELYNKLYSIRKKKNPYSDEKSVQHPFLKPLLRPYQSDAVRWMVNRENMNSNENDDLHPLYTIVKLDSGVELYYDRFTGFVTDVRPVIESCSRGGILADEMGLGKTVEVLACILSNPKDRGKYEKLELPEKCPIIEIPKRKRKLVEDSEAPNTPVLQDDSKKLRISLDQIKSTNKKSANKIALELYYNSVLSSMSTVAQPSINADEVLKQCVCGTLSDDGLVECQSCGKYQHGSCLGYNKSMGRYLCPQCWMDEPLLEVGATLIVTPISLKTQWCKEIKKHVRSNLRILDYQGHNVTPIYPTQLSNYDIVITTYAVLKNELPFTETAQVLNFRRERKYSPPGSPLVRAKWWRLCIDEAQSIETSTHKMAQEIQANFRWAVTGTPISKNISDLFGLIEYLLITPYNDYTTWKYILYDPYICGNEEPLLEFLSKVLWRTSKKIVAEQINIPKQTFVEHTMEFSAVEKYFYEKEHELSCRDFLTKVKKHDPSSLLKKLDRSVLKTIMGPLITLRHSCTHPNTMKGRYLATKKKVSSMNDLLVALIQKNVTDSEECLRLIISTLNGLAGLRILVECMDEAIAHYREVLQLASLYSDDNSKTKLTIDKLQLIHTLHNLAEVIEMYPPSNPTLRDEFLRRDCAEMEQKYLVKFMSQTATAFEDFKLIKDQVEKLQNQFVLKGGQWYSDGLDWLYIQNHFRELLDKICCACENANLHCNLRDSSGRLIIRIICNWEDQILQLRDQLFEAMEQLYEKDAENGGKIIINDCLVQKAVDCHLRPSKKIKNPTQCPLCLANRRLKFYEGKLFTIGTRLKTFEDMSLKGSWKPTMEELIIKCLLNVLKSKHARSEFIEDGETHVNLIEHLKKEFKEIRKFWTFLDQQVCARDEMDMCKIRFQLKEDGKPDKKKKINRILKHLSYNIERNVEDINLLSVYELQYHNSLLGSELSEGKARLTKLMGTQKYLETLREYQDGERNLDNCPICKNTLGQHWSVLTCGHCYCLECIHILLEKSSGDHIHCAMCRNRQKNEDISYIKAGNTVSSDEGTKIEGNYSTKIEAIVKLLLKLKAEDENVKVLLFSTWITVLDSLREPLEKNGILYERSWSGKLADKIENFKTTKNIMVLLLPVNLGSKGLNLVEATHVILVEPFLNPADELQAVGRVHRIGQTRPTTVHKFIVKNTIEESIFQATSTNAENWDQNKITLGCLIDLFKMKEDKALEPEETLDSSANVQPSVSGMQNDQSLTQNPVVLPSCGNRS